MPHKTSDPSNGMATDKYQAQMFQIFQNVQFNVVQHKKYAKELTKIYKKMDEASFRTNFARALHYLFTFGDSNASVDRVVQFVASFCTGLDDEEEFLLFIFDIIFDCQCVSGQSVRYRASQLLAAVLTALGEDASLDDDLCDKLLTSQTERLQDTRGAVRCRAALALQRLQNPMETDDPVTRAYRFHMSCDPSSSVRRAIVMSIAKCTRNVPFVLERLCDVDEAVRRAAFIYVAAINVTQLKVRQRVHVLKVGLNERSTRVRRVVEEILLPGWLSTFEGNVVALLTAVRLDNATGAKDSQYVAGKLLESLFRRLPTSELLEWLPIDKTLRVIPADKLSKETAWYWRHLAEHLVQVDDDETLETVLPDLVVLVGYIRAIVESPCPDERIDPVGFGTRQCVLHELACILKAYDAGDEVGRTALQQLLLDILTGNHGPLLSETIRALVSALELVLPEVSSRIEFVVSAVTELREPTEEPQPVVAPVPIECNEVKLKRARLRVSLNVAMEAQGEAAREQNYALAAEYKDQVDRIQRQLEDLNQMTVPVAAPVVVASSQPKKCSEPEVINRCLEILNMALDSPQITTITPLLKVVFDELQEEIFQNPNVLENSLKTVALYGMLDADFAKEHKAFFFANLLELSNETIVCTALQCICDLLCVHGLTLFEEDTTATATNHDDEQADQSDMSLLLAPSHGTVIEVLLKAMDSQCGAYRLIVVEGLCRLLILGHLESPPIISRLLLLWFSPATEEEDLLRQTIGVFFQTFIVSVDSAQDQIQKATLPTLKCLANAPAHSPLAEIDQDAVIRFIVSLTRVQQEMSDAHGGMAAMLVGALVRLHSRPVAALLCRCLSLLQPPRDTHLAADLAVTLRSLPELPDKASGRNVVKYLGALESLERTTKTFTMGTMATITEETTNVSENNETALIGRATCSLPAHPPLARSTHVVVNETVEELDIDESSPPDAETTNQIVHQETTSQQDHHDDRRVTLVRGSKVPEFDSPVPYLSPDVVVEAQKDIESDSSGDFSPRKKSRKAKAASKAAKAPNTPARQTDRSSDEGEKGIKRTRSQRSIVDVGRGSSSSDASTPAAKTKGKKTAVETPKSRKPTPHTPTSELRRSSRSLASSSSSDSTKSAKSVKSTKSAKSVESDKSDKSTKTAKDAKTVKSAKSAKSAGAKTGKSISKPTKGKGKKKPETRKSRSSVESNASFCLKSDDSADETELHTIIYDRGLEQSLLAASSDDEGNPTSLENVTIPETPDNSDSSASSSPDMLRAPARKNGNKK